MMGNINNVLSYTSELHLHCQIPYPSGDQN